MKPLNELNFSEIRILEHIIAIENQLKTDLKAELNKQGRPNIERFNYQFEKLERLRGLLNE